MDVSLYSQQLQLLLNIIFLFKWVLYSSVMASFLVGIVLLIKYLLKNKFGVKWHYFIWFLVLIKLLIPYSFQSPLSIFNIVDLVHTTNTEPKKVLIPENLNEKEAAISDTIFNNSSKQSDTSYNRKTRNDDDIIQNFTPLTNNNIYWGIFSIIWILGMFIFMIYTLVTTVCYWVKLRNQHLCKDIMILNLLSECKQIIGIKHDIQLIYTEHVNTPTLFQIIQPRILLPFEIGKQLDTEEIRFVFLHELAHLKRRDIKVGLILSVASIIHWFNPII